MNLRRAILFSSLILAMQLASAHDFVQGQVWTYKARPSESGSTLLINLVETDATLGKIFHVSVRGVKVRNRHAPSGITTELPHFPVSQQTLEESVVALTGQEAPNPEYREGYATWRRAFESGNAGIFTISVADIVSVVEEAASR
jgi:hypothetical protein